MPKFLTLGLMSVVSIRLNYIISNIYFQESEFLRQVSYIFIINVNQST